MQGLQHAANAIRHAEELADEAEDAGELRLAARLRSLAAKVTESLDAALLAHEQVGPLKSLRSRVHAELGAAYQDATFRLQSALPPAEAAALSPGTALDVAERTRYRLRRLTEPQEDPDGRLAQLAQRLRQLLARYDDALDRYFAAAALAAAHRDLAVQRSQALRLHLERAKAHLLTCLPPDSDAHARVRRRAVRTNRARWLDATEVAPLTLLTSEERPPARSVG